MQGSDHHWYSPNLRQQMTFRTYGDRGCPLLVFPSQEGSYAEYADFGMVEVARPFIEAGKIRLYCVDSIDGQSWCNQGIPPHDRALRANDYDRYIVHEMVPHIVREGGKGLLFHGASMGGYHAANFYFRHPHLADGFISLSGVYDLTLFIGDAMDSEIFYHVPLAYLPGLTDPTYLDRFRQGRLIMCVGQGDWEEPMLTQTRQMARILADKQVPATVDMWGHDVSHDWPWWKKQLRHFLEETV